jgi:lipid A oxidase
MRRTIAACIVLIAFSTAAMAQVELSFYAGAQSAEPSQVAIRQTGSDALIFGQNWKGRSLDAPHYFGVRATSWRLERFGFGLDFAHNKVYSAKLPDDYAVFEMTDGLNTLTVNAYRRWNDIVGVMTPYVGGGIGIALPHVEVEDATRVTEGYQLTGPAATWIAGASVPINDQWSVFGEYKGTFSANTADLESGGALETDIFTNAVNVGVSFNF